PASAAPLRDAVLAELGEAEFAELRVACENVVNGLPDCAMLAADLVTDLPGLEVLLAQRDEANRIFLSGFAVTEGRVRWLEALRLSGVGLSTEEADAVMRSLQQADPVLAPAPLQTLSAGPLKLLLLPAQEGNH
ncbi:MAG TPA: hypothetical protein PLH11_12510, partial [Gemmobacter sp.]|nr:hypothetical protein [Gemmobacter sp.]